MPRSDFVTVMFNAALQCARHMRVSDYSPTILYADECRSTITHVGVSDFKQAGRAHLLCPSPTSSFRLASVHRFQRVSYVNGIPTCATIILGNRPSPLSSPFGESAIIVSQLFA